MPEFRRNAGYTAYVEGWALYSEKLGYELGLYKDDFSKIGQLNYDMWRAVRLVVDTGMHAFKWTRDQAIYYFKQNTGKSDHDIENEVDRYISWPGQALAYKLGQLKIQALRAEAEKALGERFDIRAFHDQLLGSGALPLSVLEVGNARLDRRAKRAPVIVDRHLVSSLVLQSVFQRIDGTQSCCAAGFRSGALTPRLRNDVRMDVVALFEQLELEARAGRGAARGGVAGAAAARAARPARIRRRRRHRGIPRGMNACCAYPGKKLEVLSRRLLRAGVRLPRVEIIANAMSVGCRCGDGSVSEPRRSACRRRTTDGRAGPSRAAIINVSSRSARVLAGRATGPGNRRCS